MIGATRLLKILFVLPGYEPAWALGGVVTACANLARALVSQGHSVTVYCTNGDGHGGVIAVPLKVPIEVDGVCIQYFPATVKKAGVFDSRVLLDYLNMSARNFDIIYVAATFQWIGIIATRIAQRECVPCVMFLSGTFDRAHISKKKAKKLLWYQLCLKRALDRCNALHVVGPYEREQSWNYVAKWPHFLAPHCIPESNNAYRSMGSHVVRHPLESDLSSHVPVLLVAGRIDPIKRIDILLAALGTLKDKYHFQVRIAGGLVGQHAQALLNQCSDLGLDSRVIWLGQLSHCDMPTFYSTGDVFIHLSDDENFGMVVAEAMYCGLPILVSRGVGIWASLAGYDVGRCVSLDVQSVKDSLQDIFDNPCLWRSRAEQAAACSLELFGEKRVANLMANAFCDIIDGHHSEELNWHVPERKG